MAKYRAKYDSGKPVATDVLEPKKLRLLTLDRVDGRCQALARARLTMARIANDLGGPEELTTAQSQLVQRAAVLAAVIESEEARLLTGEPVDLPVVLKAVNTQRRVLATLGLQRVPRDVDADTRSDDAFERFARILEDERSVRDVDHEEVDP